MQGLIAHLSATPGALRWQGRPSMPTVTRFAPRGWGDTASEER